MQKLSDLITSGGSIIVSACLLGVECNYKSEASSIWRKRPDFFRELAEAYHLIPVCPEQLGGLPTPRIPAELSGAASEVFSGSAGVYNRDNVDVSRQFIKGAREALRLAEMFQVKLAILKAKSPSCGHRMIYDGTFSGRLVSGSGLTAYLFHCSKIKVFDEEELLSWGQCTL